MSYTDAYEIGNLSISSISLIACLWLCYKFYRMQNRTIVIQMVMMIAIFNLFQALTTIIAQFFPNTKGVCLTGQYLFNFNLWVALLWSTALAILSYKSIADPKTFCPVKFFKFCKWTIIPACAITSGLPLFDFYLIHYVDLDDKFCGIILDAESKAMKIILVSFIEGLPLVTAIAATVICYTLQIKALRQIIKEDPNFCPEKLLWFPLVQLIVYLPHTLLGITDILNEQNPNDFWSLLFFCLIRFAGFANTLVYLLLTEKRAKPKVKESLLPRVSKGPGINAPDLNDSYDETRVLKRALTNRYSLSPYE